MEAADIEKPAINVSLQDGAERKASTDLSVKILRNAIANYGGSFVNMAIGILLTPFIVHHLGDTAYGIWGLTGSIVAYFQLLDFGLSAAVVKYVAQYEAQNRQERINEVVSTLFFVYCFLGLLALGVMTILSYYFASIFHVSGEYAEIAGIVFLLAGINFVIMLPTSIFNAILVGYQRIDLNNLVGVFSQIFNACLTVVLFRLGFGLLALALVSIATTLLLAAGRFYMIKRAAPQLRIHPVFFDHRIVPQVAAFSLLVFGLNVTGIISFNLDNVVIGAFLSAAAITPFAIAYKLADFLPNFVNPFAAVFFPAFAELDGSSDRDALRHLFLESTKFSTAFAMPFAIVLLFMSESVIALWVGAEYVVGAATIAQVLVTSNLARMVGRPAMNLLLGIGKVKWYFVISLISSIVNLILSLVLVQEVGTLGVAVATAVPMLVAGPALIVHASRLIELPLRRVVREALLPPILPLLPTIVGGFLIPKYLRPRTLRILALEALLCVATYALMYIYLAMSSIERKKYARRLKELLSLSRAAAA